MRVNHIYQGDCLEIIKGFPDESIDMCLTSPPYDDLRTYGEKSKFNFKPLAKELFRLIKYGGVLVWVVGDQTINGSETGTSFRQALFFMDECKFNLHDTMIYHKDGCPYPEANRYYPAFEYMFILSKGRPQSVSLIKDKKNINYGEKVARLSSRQRDGSTIPNSASRIDPERKVNKFGTRQNVWKYSPGKSKSTLDEIAYSHPAIFPEELAMDHIRSWSKEGDIILDPLCGSGTTCKMANLLKRNYVGIEINPDYCKITEDRLRQQVL